MAMEKKLRIDAFMKLPIVTWFAETFLDASQKNEFTYEQLVDGVLIHNAFKKLTSNFGDTCQISSTELETSNSDPRARLQNLSRILDEIRVFYSRQSRLIIYFVVKLPDLVKLSYEPEVNTKEAKRLLLLLIGCWQCALSRNNRKLVEKWIKLDKHTQESVLRIVKEINDIEQNFDRLESGELQRIVQSVHQKSSPKSAENIQKQNTIEKLLKKVKDQKKESDRNVVELDVRDARLKSLEDELCKVQEQNDKLKIKEKIFQHEREELMVKVARVESLEKMSKIYEKKLSEYSAVKNKLREMEIDNDMLKKSREVDEELLKSLKSKNKSLEGKLNQWNKQILDLTEELAELKARCQEMEEKHLVEVEELNLKLQGPSLLKLDKIMLEKKNEKNEKRISKLENENAALTRSQDELKELVKNTKNKNKSMENKLNVNKLELDAQTTKIIELELMLHEQNRNCDSLAKVNRTLETDKYELTKKIEEYHNQSIEDLEYFHEEERKRLEEFNSLNRRKEKLQEKISNSPFSRKNPFRISIIDKASKFLSKSRRSSSSGTELSKDFEFHRNYHSDKRPPRECTVSDFGVPQHRSTFSNKLRSRKSLDFGPSYSPSKYTFESNNMANCVKTVCSNGEPLHESIINEDCNEYSGHESNVETTSL